LDYWRSAFNFPPHAAGPFVFAESQKKRLPQICRRASTPRP
jgi:hypothetical protein